MGDINERLAWVSSERTKKEVIKNKVDLFLRPPVGHIGTLEYDKIGKANTNIFHAFPSKLVHLTPLP